MNSFKTQLLLIGAMAMWGLNISIVKVVASIMHPMLIASVRMTVAAVVINLTLLWMKPPINLAKVPWSQWLRFVLCGVLMVYINQIFFSYGMARASAANSSLIMALSPLVASILAAFIFRESLTGIRLLGIALGFGGVFAVVISSSRGALGAASLGDALIFGAMFSFVAGGVLIQSLARQFHALFISSFIYTVGAVLLTVHALLDSSVVLNQQTLLEVGMLPWLFLLFTGIVPTALCNMLWNHAITQLGVARVSVFQYWIPVFGVGFAMLWLGEPFTVWHVLGLLGILLGTYLGTRRS